MAEPVYTTIDAVRTELGLNATELPDAAATRLILLAEDVTDELLGGYLIDEASGRKIVQADVDPWQWDKLSRFTMLLAAKLHSDPALLDGRQWQSERGPDFARSGPMGVTIGAGLIAVLNQSKLRRLGARSRPGARNILVEDFYKTTPTWVPVPGSYGYGW